MQPMIYLLHSGIFNNWTGTPPPLSLFGEVGGKTHSRMENKTYNGLYAKKLSNQTKPNPFSFMKEIPSL